MASRLSFLRFLIRPLSAFGCAFLMAGCGDHSQDQSNSPNLIVRQDFESLAGWNGAQDLPSLTTEKAHSGKYSIKVGPGLDYSVGYLRLLGQMGERRFKKLKISGWFLRPSPQAKATLVFSVQHKGASDNVAWAGLNVHDKVAETGNWAHAELEVAVPATAQFDDECRFYLWRSDPAGEVVYADDLEISVIE